MSLFFAPLKNPRKTLEVKGKYYLKANLAAAQGLYWDQIGQGWTSNARAASFYDTEAQALAQVNSAEQHIDCEVIVDQATKDLT